MSIFGGFLSGGLKNALKLICLCSLAYTECHGSGLLSFRDLLWFLAEFMARMTYMLELWFPGEFRCFGPRIEAIVLYLCCLSWDTRVHVLRARFGADLIIFWDFGRKWLEYWFSGVFLGYVPRNAILSIWLHSLFYSKDFDIWHVSFRVWFECFGF